MIFLAQVFHNRRFIGEVFKVKKKNVLFPVKKRPIHVSRFLGRNVLFPFFLFKKIQERNQRE